MAVASSGKEYDFWVSVPFNRVDIMRASFQRRTPWIFDTDASVALDDDYRMMRQSQLKRYWEIARDHPGRFRIILRRA